MRKYVLSLLERESYKYEMSAKKYDSELGTCSYTFTSDVPICSHIKLNWKQAIQRCQNRLTIVGKVLCQEKG